jgi:GNAT superfamily N-acetyltransferase
VDYHALAEAVYAQRLERMTDHGPSLRGIGAAHFQRSGMTFHVGGVQLRSERISDAVTRIIAFSRERWFNVAWTHIHGHEDASIPAALMSAGFREGETLRMLGRIGELEHLPHSPGPEVTVEPITTLEEMQAYEHISMWGFNHDPHPSLDHLLLRGRERLDEQRARWYQYYIGKLNGQPASGAYVSLWEQVPTIYGVVTAPPSRGHGLAGAVMTRLVCDITKRGYPWTCLYVAKGNPAENLYSSLGYQFGFELTTYHFNGAYW